MALLKEVTITSLVKDVPTSLVLPTVPAGLEAKIIAIEVWSQANVWIDLNVYEDSVLVKHHRQEYKRKAITIIPQGLGEFFIPADLELEADENNCFATTYYLIE